MTTTREAVEQAKEAARLEAADAATIAKLGGRVPQLRRKVDRLAAVVEGPGATDHYTRDELAAARDELATVRADLAERRATCPACGAGVAS